MLEKMFHAFNSNNRVNNRDFKIDLINRGYDFFL